MVILMEDYLISSKDMNGENTTKDLNFAHHGFNIFNFFHVTKTSKLELLA